MKCIDVALVPMKVASGFYAHISECAKHEQATVGFLWRSYTQPDSTQSLLNCKMIESEHSLSMRIKFLRIGAGFSFRTSITKRLI